MGSGVAPGTLGGHARGARSVVADPARMRAGWVSLVLGTAICAGKFVASGLTGSTALLSDAMESIVNVVAAGLLLYAVYVAARPADRDHPYGHGKVEFFSAGVEGALIAVAAATILYQAGVDLVRGPSLRRLDLGIAIAAGLAALNAGLGAYLVRFGFADIMDGEFSFEAVQGEAIGRTGRIRVSVRVENGEPVEVKIAGDAVIAFSTTLELEKR
jgi:cation diffusion facilitator family transporter